MKNDILDCSIFFVNDFSMRKLGARMDIRRLKCEIHFSTVEPLFDSISDQEMMNNNLVMKKLCRPET